MENGCTPFEGFTCMKDTDVTPMPTATDSLDSMDDSNDEDANLEQQMCCGGMGMCGLDMCGLEEPTTSSAFNNTDMCSAGMCGMEEPTTTTSAEDMFNNT